MSDGRRIFDRFPNPKPSFLGGLVLSAFVALMCLLLGEVGIRVFHPSASLWHYPNFIEVATRPAPGHVSLMQYDSVLGYEPKPNSSGMDEGVLVSFSAEGFRNHNLNARSAKGPTIYAAGDSFTEGWHVADDETWPAHLERDTGRPVLNAGVPSYGLDQVVLRAERLAAEFKSRTIVLGFIHDDIRRTTLAARLSIPKPYFVLLGDSIELRNVPVPTPPYPQRISYLRRILGYSYLLDFTMRRLGARDLWYGDGLDIGGDSVLLSCRLMERFAALVQKQEATGLVVALPEYPELTDLNVKATQRKRVTEVLTCASRAGLPTFDTYEGFVEAGVSRNPDAYYIAGHFNDRGNELVAKLIAGALAK